MLSDAESISWGSLFCMPNPALPPVINYPWSKVLTVFHTLVNNYPKMVWCQNIVQFSIYEGIGRLSIESPFLKKVEMETNEIIVLDFR